MLSFRPIDTPPNYLPGMLICSLVCSGACARQPTGGYLSDLGISQDVPKSTQVVMEHYSIHQVVSASCSQHFGLWTCMSCRCKQLGTAQHRVSTCRPEEQPNGDKETLHTTKAWQAAYKGLSRGATCADLQEAGDAEVGAV